MFPLNNLARKELTGMGSGYGLVPNRWPALTWNNADLLSVGPLFQVKFFHLIGT